MGFFIQNPALSWFILAVLLAIMEIFIPGVVLIWFALGAGVTSLVVLIFNLNADTFVSQSILFLISSFLFLIMGRYYLVRLPYFRDKILDKVNDPTLSMLTGKVTQPIAAGMPGEIELFDNFHGIKIWKAESEETIEVGEIVSVLEANGIKLIVTKK